jgi:hypothetical protein
MAHQAECHAIGCRALILPTQVFCEKHLAMLESDTRRVLDATFRPGKPTSKKFDVALAFAMNEILFFQTNGHRLPVNRDFEWDDNA